MAETRKRYAPWDIPPEEVFDALERLCQGQRRLPRKGEKAPAWLVQAAKAGKRRKAAALQAEAAERRRAAQLARWREKAKPAFSIVDRMLRAMNPGRWYARSDLMRAAGANRTARGKVNQVLLARGWVERRRNPAFRGFERRGGYLPIKEPEFLYRLTSAGEAQREMVLLRE